jgi:hypothetical protein
MGRRGRKRNELLDDLKKKTGHSELKEDTLEHTLWRKRSGRGYGLHSVEKALWKRLWTSRGTDCRMYEHFID